MDDCKKDYLHCESLTFKEFLFYIHDLQVPIVLVDLHGCACIAVGIRKLNNCFYLTTLNLLHSKIINIPLHALYFQYRCLSKGDWDKTTSFELIPYSESIKWMSSLINPLNIDDYNYLLESYKDLII